MNELIYLIDICRVQEKGDKIFDQIGCLYFIKLTGKTLEEIEGYDIIILYQHIYRCP